MLISLIVMLMRYIFDSEELKDVCVQYAIALRDL